MQIPSFGLISQILKPGLKAMAELSIFLNSGNNIIRINH